MREGEEFFNELYEKMHDEVLMYIIARCGNTEDIADIFQETFLEIVKLIRKKGIAYFKHPEAIVITIAKRKIFQHYSIMQKLGLDKIRFVPLEDVEEELVEFEDFTIEDVIITRELLEEVYKILGEQGELSKKVFYLYYYFGLPIAEISRILGISESNVKNKLYRGLKRLKREFERRDGRV